MPPIIPSSAVMSTEDMQSLRDVCATDDLGQITEFLTSWRASESDTPKDMRLCQWALQEAVQQENERRATLLIELGVPFSPYLAVVAGGKKLYRVLLAAVHQGWNINTQYSWADPPALRYVVAFPNDINKLRVILTNMQLCSEGL